MYFVLAHDITSNTYIICDNHGKNKTRLPLQNMNIDICKFDINKLAKISNGILIQNSITIIGKYLIDKNKNIRYLAYDGNLNTASLSKDDILKKYNNGLLFSNIKICDNNSIRMLSGSIPFLGRLKDKENKIDTVIKIHGMSLGNMNSPGVSKKFFGKGVKDGVLGCVKFPLFETSFDLENEILTYEIGKILGFDVAEATMERYHNSKCIISAYQYEVGSESISSLRSVLGTDNFHNRFNKNWFLQYKSERAWDKFLQMLMLDLIMRQTDRHISNIAFKDKELYSLYDNGSCLFFENFNLEIQNVDLSSRGSIVQSFFLNEHGYGWMYLEDILGYNKYKHLIPHNLRYSDFSKLVYKCYGDRYTFRNSWVTEYMYKSYLIITRQEKRWEDFS